MYKALVFDLDGVLIDSERPTFVLLQQILSRRGYQLKDSEYKRRSGKRIIPFIDEVFGNTIPKAEKTKIFDEFHDIYVNNVVKYMDPIKETIKFVKTYSGPLKIALATMSDSAEVEKILPAVGLDDCFEVIVASNHVSNLKPHPEIYLKAAKLLGLKPGDCAAIEDSLVGAKSASASGMATYIFLNGTNKPSQFAGIKIAGYIKKPKDLANLAG